MSDGARGNRLSSEFEREQAYVQLLYRQLDRMRELAAVRLDRAKQDTELDAVEREVELSAAARELAGLTAAEHTLCFGRLELSDGTRLYVGRVGIFAEDSDGSPLLLDWRAPAARPFYLATRAAPHGVRSRRRIVTKGRTVVGLDDEVLDDTGAEVDGLVGEAALLAAVESGRTGRMRDVVATLRAEQDGIIRSEHRGVLVVQGGPGTGKTVVALHRAAYLLYSQPQLAARGVLVIGPSSVFLDYIGQVLPGLGETSVVLSTVDTLVAGVRVDRSEPAEVAEVKGRTVLAEALAAAVRRRTDAVRGPLEVEVAGDVLRVDGAAIRRTVRRALSTGLAYNRARQAFRRLVIAELAEQLADLTRQLTDQLDAELAEVLGGLDVAQAVASDLDRLAGVIGEYDPAAETADLPALRRMLGKDPGLRVALDVLWPKLSAAKLVTELLAGQELLAEVAPALTAADRELLRREPGGWSAADVPLLDEAADLVDGAGTTSGSGTVAERAALDRSWTYGHVIVDEAQELSPMAWRMLMRRCPSRSMTVVGDVAQTHDPAGAQSWADALSPHVGDRWRLTGLTVNYRTPIEIMAVAADVLSTADDVVSVRTTGVEPWRRRTTRARLPRLVAELAAAESADLGDGRLAVIGPEPGLPELAAAVTAAVPTASAGNNPDLLDPVVILSVRQAKGLEFDVVLIADPDGILRGSARGRNDLYVALTRATHRLGVVHCGPVLPELTRLRPRS